jgi:preprotein translocase subunit SecF
MSEHKFRYLLPPGNNFQFVARFKVAMIVSCLLMAASIAALFVNKSVRGDYMNWTIDFKGGTEVIYAFKDKATGDYTTVQPGKVREALEKAGESGVDVSDNSWEARVGGEDVAIHGMFVRTPRFSALEDETREEAAAGFMEAFEDREVAKATWSGDRLSVRSRKPITNEEAAAALAKVGLEVKPWSPEEIKLYTVADEGTHEYNQWYAVWGLDRQYEHVL